MCINTGVYVLKCDFLMAKTVKSWEVHITHNIPSSADTIYFSALAFFWGTYKFGEFNSRTYRTECCEYPVRSATIGWNSNA